MIKTNCIESAFSELQFNGKNPDYFSKTRDVFSARLELYAAETQKLLESAIIGEIGNNSFDHNVNAGASYIRGVYFNSRFCESYVLLADFGQGLFKTLQTVLPGLRSDVEAIQIAFREKISGRMPENRGNGLKFVLKNIQEKSWDLYYHSGNAICYADASDVQFNYSDISYQGCMALISF